jgi:ribosomal protein L9
VQLAEPLKTLGEFPVTVKVFRDVAAEIKALIEKES